MGRERERGVSGEREREGVNWEREGFEWGVSGAKEGCEWGEREREGCELREGEGV